MAFTRDQLIESVTGAPLVEGRFASYFKSVQKEISNASSLLKSMGKQLRLLSQVLSAYLKDVEAAGDSSLYGPTVQGLADLLERDLLRISDKLKECIDVDMEDAIGMLSQARKNFDKEAGY